VWRAGVLDGMSQVLNKTRIQDIDALRGFALLGILIVNITFAASGFPIHVAQDPAYQSWLDHAVHWVSATFVDMKFYLLFSFLFGYSFQLQMEAAQRAGASFRPRMLRRLGGLFVIGALHAIFLITGDILSVYALIGLALLAMWSASSLASRVAWFTPPQVATARPVVCWSASSPLPSSPRRTSQHSSG